MKFAATLILAFFTLLGSAQQIEKKRYIAQRITGGEINVDGLPDEPVWKKAVWEDNFTQHEPVEGDKPSQQSAFAVMYDSYNVYVGMRLFDTSPDSIARRMTRRDEIDGDVAGIEFDSYDDKRTAFAFAITAAGVKYDFMVSDDGNNEDDTWNPIWWAEVSADSLGWYAEMRIPLTQLRFKEGGGLEWGFEAVRYLFRKDETSLWQHISRKQPGFVSQFGRISGFSDIKPRKIVDIMPYVVARTERFKKEPENPFRKSGHRNSLDAGLDAKLGLTNYLTLDLTVNPDFGQVEADPSEVNLSTYETFFEERRPFFIEGKNILHYGLNFGDGDLADEAMFYSRRIGRKPGYQPDLPGDTYAEMPEFTRILGAAKITGKTAGGWSVGLLESMTAREFADLKSMGSSSKVPVEPFTNYAIGRLQKDFNEGNTYLGGMATAVNRSLPDKELDFLHASAYTGGVDLVHKWHNKEWELDVSFFGSRVAGSPRAITRTQRAWTHLFQRPDADYLGVDSIKTVLTGNGGKIALGEYGGNLRFVTALTWKSPGLELNDVGYLREADNIFQLFWMGYRTFKPVSVFRELYINLNQWTQWNFGGDLVVPGGNINMHTSLTNYWDVSTGLNMNGEGISTSALRGGPAMKIPGSWNLFAEINSNEQKKLAIDIEGYSNTSFEKGHSRSQGAEMGIDWKPINALKISLDPGYDHNRSAMQYITTRENNGSVRYVFGSIKRNTVSARFRVNLNLTPELSIQYWGQPFIASGKYDHFKRITNSRADRYGDRFKEYESREITYDAGDKEFTITEEGFGDIIFEQPDFNVKEFLSNMVLRWEYTPGSTLYVVWSQNRDSFHQEGSFDFDRDLGRLFSTRPGNIFLLKLSYRLGR